MSNRTERIKDDAVQAVENLGSELDVKISEISELEDTVSDLESKIDDYKDKNQQLQDEIEALKMENADLSFRLTQTEQPGEY